MLQFERDVGNDSVLQFERDVGNDSVLQFERDVGNDSVLQFVAAVTEFAAGLNQRLCISD